MKAAVWMYCAWWGVGFYWVHDSVTFSSWGSSAKFLPPYSPHDPLLNPKVWDLLKETTR